MNNIISSKVGEQSLPNSNETTTKKNVIFFLISKIIENRHWSNDVIAQVNLCHGVYLSVLTALK